MAIAAPPATTTRPRLNRFRKSFHAAAILLIVSMAAGGLLWWRFPSLVAPVEDFVQGPGGAVAYVSLANQIREQSAEFWTGGDVHLHLNEEEFSGMISSALLTGRGPDDPIRRVRGSLVDGELKVETVISIPYEGVPERYRGPVGVKLRLDPVVTENGLVQFRITRASAGQIPISTTLIRLAGRVIPVDIPGYDAREGALLLPLGDMVSQSLGRQLEIKDFSAEDGQLKMTITMPKE